jgi:diacylglycerol kinase
VNIKASATVAGDSRHLYKKKGKEMASEARFWTVLLIAVGVALFFYTKHRFFEELPPRQHPAPFVDR